MSSPAASRDARRRRAKISKQILFERREALLTDRQSRRHRMTATLDEQPLRHRGANCGAEIDARNRTQRTRTIARPRAGGIPCDDAGGSAEALD